MMTGGRKTGRDALAAVVIAAALLAGALAMHAAPARAAKGECPTESGDRGNWSYFASSTKWTLKPRQFDMLPRSEKNDPAIVADFKQSVVFEFTLTMGYMPSLGIGDPWLILYVEALVNPPADIMLWTYVDGEQVLDEPFPAADPNTGTAGVFLSPYLTLWLMGALEKGNMAEFWFATEKDDYVGVEVALNGFSDAWARAREVSAKSAAEAKAGKCDPDAGLKN